MRHLNKFNESKYWTISMVEDLLLAIIDSGKLESFHIHGDEDVRDGKPVGRYFISLVFSETTVGMEKVKTLDAIIERLQRKFKWVYIAGTDSRIVLDIDHKGNFPYIKHKFVDKLNKYLDNFFNRIDRSCEADENGGIYKIYSSMLDNQYYSEYSLISHQLYTATEFIDGIGTKYMVNYNDLLLIIRDKLKEKFGIEPIIDR